MLDIFSSSSSSVFFNGDTLTDLRNSNFYTLQGTLSCYSLTYTTCDDCLNQTSFSLPYSRMASRERLACSCSADTTQHTSPHLSSHAPMTATPPASESLESLFSTSARCTLSSPGIYIPFERFSTKTDPSRSRDPTSPKLSQLQQAIAFLI